jgi:hypothetical protein
MQESESAEQIVYALEKAAESLEKGEPTSRADAWMKLADKWIHVHQQLDLDYDVHESPVVTVPVQANGMGDYSYGLSPASGLLLDDGDEEDDDPDDIKRLGPIEPL